MGNTIPLPFGLCATPSIQTPLGSETGLKNDPKARDLDD